MLAARLSSNIIGVSTWALAIPALVIQSTFRLVESATPRRQISFALLLFRAR